MSTQEFLPISHRLKVNESYPYGYELRKARDWLKKKGITQVKPVFQTKPS